MNPLFYERIQSYIPEEYDQFLDSLQHDMLKGLRRNQKKIEEDLLKQEFPFLNQKSPFCSDSYYVSRSLGNHPFHFSGCYYLQEPSASSAVTILDVQADDIVLDLCAAPGGKSTQIGAKLGNHGFLVCNEFDSKRAKTLLSNIERMGLENVMVTNLHTEKLCTAFASCFDKILVDAPCSGEGMIKKHEAAHTNWSLENIQFCQSRQLEILDNAYKALKKDGILVYSTCTYAKEENEECIAAFLKTHPDMELVDVHVDFGRRGLSTQGIDASKVCRIFPMDHGEGHFVAKLQKKEGMISFLPTIKPEKMPDLVANFLNDQLSQMPSYIHIENNKVYAMEMPFLKTKGLKVIRQGVLLGEIVKNRFEPAHSFYLCANWIHQYRHTIDLDLEQVDQVLHGYEIETASSKGYVALCYRGIPFGFGKSDGRRVKNKIPKGLRLFPNSHVFVK